MMGMLAGRLLMAVLVKHHGLGRVVLSLLSSDSETSAMAVLGPPRCLVDVCKIVHQARTALIKVFNAAQMCIVLTEYIV